MNGLREAAQAVIEQWDTPNWKLVVHTGVLIDRLRAALAQPETDAPRDEWRPASEPQEDLRGRVIAWRHPPQRQGGAWIEALYDDGAWVTRDGIAHDITHWRDVQPPTESTIATEIAAARDEVKTWPKWMQDAARASAVAVPPTEGEP